VSVVGIWRAAMAGLAVCGLGEEFPAMALRRTEASVVSTVRTAERARPNWVGVMAVLIPSIGIRFCSTEPREQRVWQGREVGEIARGERSERGRRGGEKRVGANSWHEIMSQD